LNEQSIGQAAQFLIEARKARRPGGRIPEAARPTTVDDALAIQQRVTQSLGLPVGGWKCSLPVEPRPVSMAPIYAPVIVRTSPCRILPVAGKARVEPEVAFVLGRDLGRADHTYTEAEVRDAIAEARLVLELIGPRYADPASVPFIELLADNVANQGLYVGPVVPGALDRALATLPIEVTSNGRTIHTADGKHPDGHPLRPLVWLATFLARRGEGLRAGQVATTGSYCGLVDVPLDAALEFRFGDLGVLPVTFNAAS
jgi:2-keto-4-pentenoate hydratase